MQLTEVTAVPVIIGLVQLAKEAGFPNRFLPLLDLVLGILAGVVIYGTNWQVSIANGVILGLAAAGLYRSGKVVVRGE
jgi:hypothetical protein